MTEKPYAGKLADERRAERRARLMAAGFELLGTAGTTGTTVRAVCQKSGLTSRYFYESFANLDELLLAIFDDIMARTLRKVAVSVAASDGTVQDAVEAITSAFATVLLDDPIALRVGFVEGWNSEALMRRRVETLHAQAKLLATTVAPKGLAEERRQAVEVTSFMVIGGLLEAVLGWLDGALAVDRDTLISRFSAAAAAALESAITEQSHHE